jgi:hypothetical protein
MQLTDKVVLSTRGFDVLTYSCVVARDGDGANQVVLNALAEDSLLHFAADRLHEFSATIITALWREQFPGRRGQRKSSEKARELLEALQRPAETVANVVSEIQKRELANAAKRAKKEEDGQTANSDGGEEQANVIDDIDERGYQNNDLDADCDENPIVGADEEPTAAADDAVAMAAGDGDSAAAMASAADVGSRKPAASRQTLPLPIIPEKEFEAPPGCSMTLGCPREGSSACWLGRLPHGQAFEGKASISRSFASGDACGPKRSTLSNLAAQKVVHDWLWQWFDASDDQKEMWSATWQAFYRPAASRAPSSSQPGEGSSSSASATKSSSSTSSSSSSSSSGNSSSSSSSALPGAVASSADEVGANGSVRKRTQADPQEPRPTKRSK